MLNNFTTITPCRAWLRIMPCMFALSATLFGQVHSSPMASPPIPQLRKQGTAWQLIVDGKPFVILGGELHNSSASNSEYMKPLWPRLKALNLNTVLASVSWELIEPREGEFSFALVDSLISEARNNHLRLVFLWFGSWKNGVSSYAPLWVKTDLSRFPRVQKKGGVNLEVLSTLSEPASQADAKAFSALMRHINRVDTQHTVLMMQVENEVGILGEPRDHSPLAEAAWSSQVPHELMDYLQAHKTALLPELREVWGAAGFRSSGTWAEVFGDGPEGSELFMAWNYGRYIGKVVAAGKKEYSLPMYVNAWLVQDKDQKAGGYPSGGPVSRVMDVWHAAAPEVDFLSPDIYLPDFKGVCASYARAGNPLLIPEAGTDPMTAANVFWAVGQHDALGFSPFGMDSPSPSEAVESGAREQPLAASYAVLFELMPLISQYQGTGKMAGILQTTEQKESIVLGNYRVNIEFIPPRERTEAGSREGRTARVPNKGYGLIVNTGPDEYVVAGSGFSLRFAANSPGPRIARVGYIDEGQYVNGKWVAGRRLNGDENAGGAGMYLRGVIPTIQKIKLYRHD